MRRWIAAFAMVLFTLLLASAPAAARPAPSDTDPNPAIMYFFWGEGCPHCAAAKPFLAELEERYPGFEVRSYEVYNDMAAQELLFTMAAATGFEVTGVPTFIMGDEYWVGFSETVTGPQLEAAVTTCLASGCPDAGAGIVSPVETAEPTAPAPSASPTPPVVDPDPEPGTIDLPIFGRVDVAHQSLIVTTALIALVDGFNPCSLWVLSVLLALTLRSGSRRKTVIVGLVFIFVTALVYALFIAGMFTVFTVVNVAPWVRVLVALVALGFAAVNIKDYFWFREGISFTIPDDKKPGIYRRIRTLMARSDSMPALIGGTIVLAAGVSTIELACTAGFPVLWTNLLTDQGVGVGVFLGLLLLYMLIYQLDELAIFGVAVVSLKASKLEEKHGRVLKLVGGMLLLTLAIVMIIDPTVMSTVGGALTVFGIAVAATLLVLLLHRLVLPRLGIHIGTEQKRPALAGAAHGGTKQGGPSESKGTTGTKQGSAAGTSQRVDSRGKPVARSKPRGR